MKIGFDNEKYLQMQSEQIMGRINQFNNKLYLEFGGKLFDDYHAARVLPGFAPDSKLRMLKKLSNQLEIVIVISASDIEKHKIREDLGITYETDVLRLIDFYRSQDLYVGSIVITQYSGQYSADNFKSHLEKVGITVYTHYIIHGYPNNIALIVSEDGYGKNDYIKTSRPLVVVTAPGPGSGKMATCLSQLYHEHQRGIIAGYAKFETFPVWNLPLRHPVNLAYEAATADLDDINMIDPFHLEAYNTATINYNRDVENFPVLNSIFDNIYGKSPYKSPTDMGVNMAGNCISDDWVCQEASRQEIIRRYYSILCGYARGHNSQNEVYKIERLLQQGNIRVEDRSVVKECARLTTIYDTPVAVLELPNGDLVKGKTSELLGSSAALLLNALKTLAGIDHQVKLVSPASIEPIQKLKTCYLGSKNPRLHTDEVLIALSVSAATDPAAAQALEQLPLLEGCQAHTSVMISDIDAKIFKKLKIQQTSEAKYEKKGLYH